MATINLNYSPTVVERATDWIIGLVSDKRVALRQHFRRMDRDPVYRESVLLGLRMRGYRAASMSSQQTPWHGREGRSADAELAFDRRRMIARSREVNRDDPIASGLTETLVNRTVGKELIPQARTGDKEKNQRLEEVWRDRRYDLFRADQVTIGQGQQLIVRKYIEDGDILIKRVFRSGEPVWFELVEADRILTPFGSTMGPRIDIMQRIRDGVEKDEDGVPVAYHVMNRHPGGDLTQHVRREFTRVPVEDARMWRNIKRPGQTRGVIAFHAILQDLRDLDLLMVASLKRVQIAACLSVFITSQEDIPDLLDVTAEKYGYKLDQTLEPAMIMKLFPGETVETVSPNYPTSEFEPFIKLLAMRIGAALSISPHLVMSTFDDTNYSVARTDLIISRPYTDCLRQASIHNVFDWLWVEVQLDAMLRGDARLRGVTEDEIRSVGWIAPGEPWVDPQKEAMAVKMALEMGITTLRDEIASHGKDWEEVLEQRAKEIEKMAELGINLPETSADDPQVVVGLG